MRTCATSSRCSRRRELGGEDASTTTSASCSAICNYAMAPQRRWLRLQPVRGCRAARGARAATRSASSIEAEWEAVLRHVQPGDSRAARPGVLPDRDHGRAAARRADRAALARRRLARRPHPCAAEPRARRVATPRSRAGAAAACRWPTAWRASWTGCYKARRRARRTTTLVFADPAHRRGRSTRRPTCQALPQGAAGAAGLDVTHQPARAAPHVRHPDGRRRACRCAPCRSGWATAISRRRSGTPTTRRPPHERDLIERAWAPAGRGHVRGHNLTESQDTSEHPAQVTEPSDD